MYKERMNIYCVELLNKYVTETGIMLGVMLFLVGLLLGAFLTLHFLGRKK